MTHQFKRLVALRYRDFRLLWLGETVAWTGSQMRNFAINWHVFELLRGQTFVFNFFGNDIVMGSDAFGLGMLGLARVIPVILFAMLGGMLADAFERRLVMVATQCLSALLTATLALLTLNGQVSVGAIYVVTGLSAAAMAFDFPARQSIVANVVEARHLSNAISLNALVMQVATIIGPAVAGLLVAQFNVGLVYGVNAVTFLLSAVAIWRIRHRGKSSAGAQIGWRTLLAGLRFTFSTRIVLGTMLLDFFATLFASARTMLPIVAGQILGVGAAGYGLLATAQPIGALLVGTVLSLRGEMKRQGLILLLSVALYGLATAIFGVSTVFALSFVLFALTGAGDTISSIIRGTIRQLATPDALRGQMTSANMLFFMTGPQLGELRAGILASLFGAPLAIFSGGLATVLMTGWVAWRYPSIRRYNNAEDLKRKRA